MLCLILIASALSCQSVLARSRDAPVVQKAKINYLVDIITESLNSVLPNQTTLPDMTVEDVVFHGITVHNLNTLKRIGDTYTWTTSDNTIHTVGSVGLQNTMFKVKEMDYKGEEIVQISFAVAKNIVEFEYSITIGDTNCTMDFQKMNITKLGPVTTLANKSKFNRKNVSENFNKYVLPVANEKLTSYTVLQWLKVKLAPYCIPVEEDLLAVLGKS